MITLFLNTEKKLRKLGATDPEIARIELIMEEIPNEWFGKIDLIINLLLKIFNRKLRSNKKTFTNH